VNDPIEPVIQAINQSEAVRTARQRQWLNPSFLNNVAEVFERDGFETTRLYLLGKKDQQGMGGQASALLAVLEHMRDCPAIHQRRAIGRAIIKTLSVSNPPSQHPSHKGGRQS
jgi:hypothetical protein